MDTFLQPYHLWCKFKKACPSRNEGCQIDQKIDFKAEKGPTRKSYITTMASQISAFISQDEMVDVQYEGS